MPYMKNERVPIRRAARAVHKIQQKKITLIMSKLFARLPAYLNASDFIYNYNSLYEKY